MHIDDNNDETLLVDPVAVKQVAIDHFKTIAGASPTVNHNINTIPLHWQDIYQPMDEVDHEVYQNLLSLKSHAAARR